MDDDMSCPFRIKSCLWDNSTRTCTWNERTCSGATKNDHLTILEWSHNNSVRGMKRRLSTRPEIVILTYWSMRVDKRLFVWWKLCHWWIWGAFTGSSRHITVGDYWLLFLLWPSWQFLQSLVGDNVRSLIWGVNELFIEYMGATSMNLICGECFILFY